MTYPNYPPQQQPQYPPQQQPQYQQPAYPPQQQPPAYPPQPQYQQPGYPPQQQPQYPPPPPPQAHGTIDDFYDQPAASGKSIASWFQTPGQSITGMIARTLTNADTRPQTDMQTKQPKFYSDGTPMRTLTIPLLVTPSPDFPDGRAAWIINASDREDLDMAMQAAGCKPRTVPEPGALITVTFTGLKQIPGFGVPKKIKQVSYQRPAAANGNGQAAAPAAQAPPATAPATAQYATQYAAEQPQQMPGAFGQPVPAGVAPAPQYAPQPAYSNGQYQQAPPQYMQQDPYAVATGQPQDPPTAGAASAPPASTPGAPPTAAASPSSGQYAVPGNLTPEQEERLRQITGGQ